MRVLITVPGSGGVVKVAAATRKAVVRKNVISVYLFSNLLRQSADDYKKFIGSSFRIDGTGVSSARFQR